MDHEFTIGELSREVGVSIETIRYYERKGLMPRVRRTTSGRRSYRRDEVRTLSFIKRCRSMGFTLEDIGALLTLRQQTTCCDVRAIASRHLENMRARVRMLMELERALSEVVNRCPNDTSSQCTILDLLDQPLALDAAETA